MDKSKQKQKTNNAYRPNERTTEETSEERNK